jgi:hypothetical protein
MKQHLISSTDRYELSRLVIDAIDTAGIQRFVTKVSMLSPQAIYEVENVVGCFPHVIARQQSRSWFRPATNRGAENDPIRAPVLMFNRSGYVREAALKALGFGALRRTAPLESCLDCRLARSLGRRHFCSNECPFGVDGIRHQRSCSTH